MNLKLTDIRRDDSAQPRAMLNTDHIKDLADALEDGGDLTPVDVFHDGHSYWLADGFHRYSAYHRAKREEIPVNVHEGDLRDAVLYSITVNAKHTALKLTREEKRAGVSRLLADEEWGQWSDREIGRRAGVSAPTVGAIRKELPICKVLQIEGDELSAENPQIERKVKRGDSEYTMQTPAPKADSPAAPTPSATASADLSDYLAPRPTPGYNPARHADNSKLEDDMLEEAEIVPDEPPEDEPYIPPYVSNPVRETFEIKKLSNEPKSKEPPFVEWYVLLGKVQSKGHRSLIEALNSLESQMQGGELEARIDGVIEMLRASVKQAKVERTTFTVQS